MPKHVHVNPSEVVVLHDMTLQDLANCMHAFRGAVQRQAFQELPDHYVEMLKASYERVQDALHRCELEEAQKHLADGESVGEINETFG